MKVVRFSSHRMRERGLDFAAPEVLITGDDCPVAVYSHRRGSNGGMYLVSDALAKKIVEADVYVGNSKPSVLRGPVDDLCFCWGSEPTRSQREWLYAQCISEILA